MTGNCFGILHELKSDGSNKDHIHEQFTFMTFLENSQLKIITFYNEHINES